jgi:hypothetical protein
MSHSGPKNPPKVSSKQPPKAHFWCGNPGHWEKSCPNPHPPTRPRPQCGQWGHWKMDCPQGKLSFRHTQPQIPNTVPAKDPISMFPLGDWQGLDHKAPATGEYADPWVTRMVSGKHISFFLHIGGIEISFNRIHGSSQNDLLPYCGGKRCLI